MISADQLPLSYFVGRGKVGDGGRGTDGVACPSGSCSGRGDGFGLGFTGDGCIGLFISVFSTLEFNRHGNYAVAVC